MNRQHVHKIALALALAVPGPAVAEASVQDEVLECLANIGSGTDWNTCLKAMFAPCAMEKIGSDPHLECLSTERADWRAAKNSAEASIVDDLTNAGMEELSGLMLAWPKFVDNKCTAVAEGRADISYDAAQIGCQIAEIALMTNELTACAEGRSVEDYCQFETQ